MAKFSGKIGYSTSQETAPGVWRDAISEREYYCDVIRESKQWTNSGQQLNDSVTVNNRVSVLADDFAFANFSGMRYIIWDGVYWKISSVEIQRPRLILSLGTIYNGPKYQAPAPPPVNPPP